VPIFIGCGAPLRCRTGAQDRGSNVLAVTGSGTGIGAGVVCEIGRKRHVAPGVVFGAEDGEFLVQKPDRIQSKQQMDRRVVAVTILATRDDRSREEETSRCGPMTAYATISASSIRLPDGSAKKASLRLMASSLNGSVTILTPRALRSATAFSISGTLMQKW
jgi:hypothetical protein